MPTLSIGDADAVQEGSTASFEVTLSEQSEQEVTVEYATENGTAIAGEDYTETSGTLTFDANVTRHTIEVMTADDDVDESDEESFTVKLSEPSGATLNDDTGSGSIADNDDLPSVSVVDLRVDEGGKAEFEVTLSEASGRTVTLDFQTSDDSQANDDTAIAGSDYSEASGTLTFDPGSTKEVIEVRTIDDEADEPDEAFSVWLSNLDGATALKVTGVGMIIDDDEAPEVSIADATAVDEGESALFEVTLNEVSGRVVTVMYRTVEDTATASSDYTPISGMVTFEPGTRLQTITVGTVDDEVSEAEEGFDVELYDPTESTLDDETGRGTINDDDDPPEVSIADATPVGEGGTATFKVTLSEVSGQEVSVEYETMDGTATAGDDYTSASDSLTFDAGEMEHTISVSLVDDDAAEDPETFTVELRSPSGATIGNGSATGTITDDDGTGELPSLSIAGPEPVMEGGDAVFTVTLNDESAGLVTVRFATEDGSAVAGSDYTAASGTLSFSAGDTARTIRVAILDDEAAEQSENFSVELADSAGATIQDGTATATITDDDADKAPEVSIADAQAVGEPGTAQFEVTLSAPGSATVTVEYRTLDGTAVANRDYSAATGTLTFSTNETAKTIAVAVREDSIAEQTENFRVELHNPMGATLGTGIGWGTITDDDQDQQPALSISDAPAVLEGETTLFRVKLSAVSSQTVTVAYGTVDGTAEAGTDYTATRGTLNFGSGTSELTIAVPTVEDGTQEPTEMFTLELSSPSGASLEDDTATGTITDDDNGARGGLPALAIADAAPMVEGNAAEFVVTLNPASAQSVNVAYATEDGTALAGSDYVANSGRLNFGPQETSKTIRVPSVEDMTREETESFVVNLSAPAGATLENDAATGMIVDNDEGELPALSIRDALPVGEGETAEFVVALSAASDQVVTASYRTLDGTASASSDFESISGTLRFEAGETTKTISVPTVEDEIREDGETFTVGLSAPSGATLEDDTGAGTIVDDDDAVDSGLPQLSIADAAPVREGGTAQFTVRLDPTSSGIVSVSYASADGTATAGSDYRSTAGPLRFEAGQATQTIAVSVLDDDVSEVVETFTVALSNPVGARLVDRTGVGMIAGDAEEIVDSVNRVLLPEVGRAMAFTPVRCRIDQLFSDVAGGGAPPSGRLSLSPLPTHAGWNAASIQVLNPRPVLGDSSFLLPLKSDAPGGERLAAWGCGDFAALAGGIADGSVDWDGIVSTVQIGADLRITPNLLIGLSMSKSFGDFDYHAQASDGEAGDGERELRLAGLHPYIGWSVTPDLDVWGSAGLGWGELRGEDERVEGLLESNATLDSIAVGFSSRLMKDGDTSIRLKGEGALAGLDVAGARLSFGAMSMDMLRLRLGMVASHEYALPAGGSLVPVGRTRVAPRRRRRGGRRRAGSRWRTALPGSGGGMDHGRPRPLDWGARRSAAAAVGPRRAGPLRSGGGPARSFREPVAVLGRRRERCGAIVG